MGAAITPGETRLPPGWRWRRTTAPWRIELLHGDVVRAAVHLSPCKERPYSLAYTDIGRSGMGGHSHPTRMAAIRACESWARELAATAASPGRRPSS